MRDNRPIVIIGAGPAGLAAAEVLAQAGHRVQVYEQKPTAARKFLMAGKTGLNISHTEDFEQFISRYDQPDWLRPMILPCQSSTIEQWMESLGIASYVGSSGRLFPVAMKAAPLLRAWLNRLKQLGVKFFYRHQWLGWNDQNQLRFLSLQNAQQPAQQQAITVDYHAVVLATGGGSWARLGSDAAWVELLQQQQIKVLPLQASNVGIRLDWSEFMQPLAGQPLKRINAWVDNTGTQQGSVEPPQVYHGEAVISHYGLEGGLIYRLNRDLRESFNQQGQAVLYLDLLPDLAEDILINRLESSSKPSGTKQSLANRWRKAGLDPVKIALIREILPRSQWQIASKVAAIIKQLPLTIQGFQPIDEAISTAGGVDRQAMTDDLMLVQKPGVFCCGEMLDWDAPTGGYLLTACLATGQQAAQGVIQWLGSNSES